MRRLSWVRNAAFTSGFAVLSQLLSATAGLIFVNLLTKDEFALVAVFTALLQAFLAHSDLGTLGAVGYFYRECGSRTAFKTLMLPAIARARLQLFSLSVLVLIILFVTSRATPEMSMARFLELLVLALGTATFGLANGLQAAVLGARGQVGTQVRIDAAANLVRLSLTAGIMAFSLLSAETALMTGLLSAFFTFLIGRSYVPEVPLWLPEKCNKDEQYRLFRYIIPLIPGVLYYSIQPTMLIWLSAFFGNTERIAEVGAISRIGQILTFLNFGLTLFVMPHLTGSRDDQAFRRSYIVIWVTILSVVSGVFLTIVLSTHQVLLLLGPQYAALDTEVLLVAGTSLLNVAVNYTVMVNRIRGWNKLEPVSTLAQLVGQVVLIACLPLGSTASILTLGLAYAGVSAVTTLTINVIGFTNPELVGIAHQSAAHGLDENHPRPLASR